MQFAAVPGAYQFLLYVVFSIVVLLANPHAFFVGRMFFGKKSDLKPAGTFPAFVVNRVGPVVSLYWMFWFLNEVLRHDISEIAVTVCCYSMVFFLGAGILFGIYERLRNSEG